MLPLLVYIILLNIVMAIAIIVIHEEGHFFAGEQSGCENMKIVLYDASLASTYTQMNCPPETEVNLVLLGGFLFTTPFALLFFVLRGFPEKYFYLIIIGFNLTISSSDILFLTKNLFTYVTVILGIIVIIFGEIKMIDSVIMLEENII